MCRVTFSGDAIEVSSLWRARQLQRAESKGYRSAGSSKSGPVVGALSFPFAGDSQENLAAMRYIRSHLGFPNGSPTAATLT
jgi:hypothetical protein